jgi:hypothetical protein
MGSLGVQPRRGALGKGSRRARAAAAACLAALAVAAALPGSAEAYPCGERATPTAARELMSIPPDECSVPETLRRSKPRVRERKTGSISTLTVFVLAVAAALLIPIGRSGLRSTGDPFGHGPTYEPRKSRIS